MNSPSIAGNFIHTLFDFAGDLLEPDHWFWSLPNDDDGYDRHVVLVSKPPYAKHAGPLRDRLRKMQIDVPITVYIHCHSKRGGLAHYIHLDLLPDRETIDRWLSWGSNGEAEKICVLEQNLERIIVRCGDTLQAGRLSDRLGWLVKTGLKFVEIYVGTRVFGNIALERIAKDDRHRFIYSLLPTHQEILEAGGMAINDEKVRLYCRSKEDAIALNHGKWDLAERAQEQHLPQQFEVYYFGDDKQPCLYKTFSMKGALSAGRLRRREIAELFQDLDIENP